MNHLECILIGLQKRLKEDGDRYNISLKETDFSYKVNNNLAFRTKILKAVGLSIPSSPIKEGIEITTELWFDGNEIIHTAYAMRDRHLMDGGKGPIVDSMGSVYWIGNAETRLFREGIGKIIPFLKRVENKGPMSITTVVTKDKLHVTDITAGFSYNHSFIFFELYEGSLVNLFMKTPDKFEFKSDIGIAVDLSILPFPLDYLDFPTDTTPIEGLNKNNLRHFWGYDIDKTLGKYHTVGKGGRIGTVTARGDNIGGFSPLRDAKRRVYRTISNIHIPGLMYRGDIGARVEHDKAKLVNQGWL